MAQSVAIARSVADKIYAEVARQPEIECCGLMGGADGVVTRVYPAPNVLASATAYEIAPEEMFRIMREMRADGVQFMGIYHSHPCGENYPSPSDVARAFYPDAIYFIVSPAENAPRPLRAFRIRNGIVTELRVKSVA
jgi:proteasome lid subunit RPN8/RPN11